MAGHDISAQAYLIQGDIQSAEKEQRAASALLPNHYLGKSLKAMIAAARGDRAAMEKAVETFRIDAEVNHWAAARVALCYAKLNDRAKAVEWLKRAAALGNHSWYYFIKHPWAIHLQNDAEFKKIMDRMKADLDDVRDDTIGVYQLICSGARPNAS